MSLEKRFSANALRDCIMAALILSNDDNIPFCDMMECAMEAKNAILDAKEGYDARIIFITPEYSKEELVVDVAISDTPCTDIFTKIKANKDTRQIIIETRRYQCGDFTGDLLYSNILSY